ncbi:MAG: preprotein translocase subunit SecA, partial [Myxococcales bacterium]|nr:preprotein translocase subunit SecA [Myxococcales bacterium]
LPVFAERCDADGHSLRDLGGLYIIGSPRPDSLRIDNQLRGRAGRQGDPGESRFFLSLEDDLMRIFGADRITGLMERLGMEEDIPIEAPLVNRAIENAQGRVEAMHFDTRKNLFEYDNVMNDQRKAIYALRKQILEGRYQPEILDEQARKEQRHNLPPPPDTSGPYTVESMSELVRERVIKTIDEYCREVMAQRGEDADVPEPFPSGGLNHHNLTHELYRRFGAMVPLQEAIEDRKQTIETSIDVVARSLIQQRERIHDLAFKKVDEMVMELCPDNVHPDDWNLPGLEVAAARRFGAKLDLRTVEDNIEKLVDRVWNEVEARLTAREEEAGLYTYLFYVRQAYLGEIDEQWIAHLKNIEHLRTGIGLVGYATRNPKNEYKIRGYNLFKDMWESIEQTVLDKFLSMRLTAAQRAAAEEGAEYETAVTRANRGARARGGARKVSGDAQAQRLQAAAQKAMQQLNAMKQAAESIAPASHDDAIAAAAAEAAAKSLKEDGEGRKGRRRRRRREA